MLYNFTKISLTGIHAGTAHFTCEYLVLPVNDSSGNVYLKCYEVDSGPEEPMLEKYIGFDTDQESVTCELGNSPFIFFGTLQARDRVPIEDRQKGY